MFQIMSHLNPHILFGDCNWDRQTIEQVVLMVEYIGPGAYNEVEFVSVW
jgi:hypothetical protein